MNDEVASIEQLLDSLHVVPLACEPQATTLVPDGNADSIAGTRLSVVIHRYVQSGVAFNRDRRGRIQHVQSREGIAFLDFDTLLSFPRRFGIRGDDRD